MNRDQAREYALTRLEQADGKQVARELGERGFSEAEAQAVIQDAAIGLVRRKMQADPALLQSAMAGLRKGVITGVTAAINPTAKQASMKIDGTFAPPVIGRATVPIPIAGPGSCEIAEAGLVVVGSRPRTGMVCFLALASIGVSVTAILLLSHFFGWQSEDATVKGIAMAIGTGIVTLTIGNAAFKRGKPVQYTFPWKCVSNLKTADVGNQPIEIDVKQFRPKGTLHFLPASDRAGFIAALRARLNTGGQGATGPAQYAGVIAQTVAVAGAASATRGNQVSIENASPKPVAATVPTALVSTPPPLPPILKGEPRQEPPPLPPARRSKQSSSNKMIALIAGGVGMVVVLGIAGVGVAMLLKPWNPGSDPVENTPAAKPLSGFRQSQAEQFLRAEIEKEILNYRGDYFGYDPKRLIVAQFKGMTCKVEEGDLSEADALNGIKYRAFAVCSSTTTRFCDLATGRWSEWHQGDTLYFGVLEEKDGKWEIEADPGARTSSTRKTKRLTEYRRPTAEEVENLLGSRAVDRSVSTLPAP